MAKQDISGKDVLFKVGGVVVGCATDISVTYTTDMQEATGCRDTVQEGVFKSFKPGQNSWTAEAGNAQRRLITGADKTTNKSFTDFYHLWKTQTLIELEWGTEFDEDEVRTGFAYITSITETNPLNETATWSVSFQGTGTIEETVNPAA